MTCESTAGGNWLGPPSRSALTSSTSKGPVRTWMDDGRYCSNCVSHGGSLSTNMSLFHWEVHSPGDDMLPNRWLYAVAIRVKDLAKSEVFYRETLGLQVGLRDERRRWLFLRAGGRAGSS